MVAHPPIFPLAECRRFFKTVKRVLLDAFAWPLLGVEYKSFYFQLMAEVSIYFVVKLWSIISCDRLRYSEPAYNILPHKLGDVLVFDGSEAFGFYLFDKVVGRNQQQLFLSWVVGSGPTISISH